MARAKKGVGQAEPPPRGKRSQIKIPRGWARDGWTVKVLDGVSYLVLPADKLRKLGSGPL
jgi:hypothetical protein